MKTVDTNDFQDYLLSKLRTFKDCEPIKVLEVGFGNEKLIQHLLCHSDITVNIFGVEDFNYKSNAFSKKNVFIKKQFNKKSYQIIALSETNQYPFLDNQFKVIYSNQVLEHIDNIESLIKENLRILDVDGIILHTFPLKNKIIESHLRIPFVHRIKNQIIQEKFIYFLSFLLMGKFKYKKKYISLKDFSVQRAEYLNTKVHYISLSELIFLLKNLNQNCSLIFLKFKISFNLHNDLTFFTKILIHFYVFFDDATIVIKKTTN